MWTNTEEEIIKGIIKHGPKIIEYCNSSALWQYTNQVDIEHLPYPLPTLDTSHHNWFIPNSYKTFDIEEYCYSLCNSEIEVLRVETELNLYQTHNMMPILQTMKYIVDTLRNNNIVWGVGRGSSVSSYVLFLLGVHKVNSIQYKLDITEFIR